MSTPAEKVTADIRNTSDTGSDTSSDEGQAANTSNDLTFEQKVNQAVDTAEKDDKGNIILPDDLPEDIKFAARSEKRRRDTQSALAKATSALSVSEAKNEEFEKLVRKSKRVELTPEEKEDLDELKHTDPDAWREKMNAIEQNSNNLIDSEISEISTAAGAKGIVGERMILLEAFQHDNPGLVINDDVLANDVPPRILSPLEKGEISFIEFLGNVKEYLESGKVIHKEVLHDDPNLSKVGGSDIPGNRAEKKDSDTSYEKAIF